MHHTVQYTYGPYVCMYAKALGKLSLLSLGYPSDLTLRMLLIPHVLLCHCLLWRNYLS